jgi:hypothetical protein
VKLAFLNVLLAVHVVAHTGKVVWPVNDKPLAYAIVYVKSCTVWEDEEKFIPIYEDKDLTIRLPNPFIAERDGEYTFFATTSYVNLKYASSDGKEIWTGSCPLSPRKGR